MLKITLRWYFLIAFITVSLLLASSFFSQFIGYHPCRLCLIQRLLFMVIAMILLAGIVHNPQAQAQRVYGGLVIFFAFLGECFAGYQRWLQQAVTDQVTICSTCLTRLITQLPGNDHLAVCPFGQCSVSDYQLLGLSFTDWALIFFGLLLLFALWLFLKKSP